MDDGSRLKEELRSRQRELRDLLNEWDPIGVMGAGAPKDEYDCFLGVIGDLRGGMSEVDLVRRFESQLRDHFGLDPEPARQRDFAHRIFDWYWRSPLPGSVPPKR